MSCSSVVTEVITKYLCPDKCYQVNCKGSSTLNSKVRAWQLASAVYLPISWPLRLSLVCLAGIDTSAAFLPLSPLMGGFMAAPPLSLTGVSVLTLDVSSTAWRRGTNNARGNSKFIYWIQQDKQNRSRNMQGLVCPINSLSCHCSQTFFGQSCQHKCSATSILWLSPCSNVLMEKFSH